MTSGEVLAESSAPVYSGPMARTALEVVGEAEIAERLGVKRQTVNQWRFRGLLPEPLGTVSGFPAWDWRDIAKWAKTTGRL